MPRNPDKPGSRPQDSRERSYEELYAEYHDKLLREVTDYIAKYYPHLHNPETDAEDITQSVLTRVLERGQWGLRSSTILQALRADAAQEVKFFAAQQEKTQGPFNYSKATAQNPELVPDPSIDSIDLEERLINDPPPESVIDKLEITDEQKNILKELFVVGGSRDEVAEKLGIPVEAVANTIRRVGRHLRRQQWEAEQLKKIRTTIAGDAPITSHDLTENTEMKSPPPLAETQPEPQTQRPRGAMTRLKQWLDKLLK